MRTSAVANTPALRSPHLAGTVPLLCGLLTLGLAPQLRAQENPVQTPAIPPIAAPLRQPGDIEPGAKRVLEEMVRAYRGLHRLEQDTSFTTEEGMSSRMIRSRLVVQKPNRLLLELIQQMPGRETPYLSRFQCDGKDFYSYQETNGWYKKEKAPKSLKDFDFLAVSLEMAAITGLDLLPPLLTSARTVRLDTPQQADGVMNDIVVLDTSDSRMTRETRLYIGQEDHLLRRFEMISQPKPLSSSSDKTDPTELETSRVAAPITRYIYDNHIRTGREIIKDAFVWVAPPNAFIFAPLPTVTGGKTPKGGGQASNVSTGMPPGITPAKVISIQDLIKNAEKNTKKQTQKKR